MANRKNSETQEATITFRLDNGQKSELEKYASLYNKSISDLARESVSLWLNMQTPKGKKIESMVSQSG